MACRIGLLNRKTGEKIASPDGQFDQIARQILQKLPIKQINSMLFEDAVQLEADYLSYVLTNTSNYDPSWAAQLKATADHALSELVGCSTEIALEPTAKPNRIASLKQKILKFWSWLIDTFTK